MGKTGKGSPDVRESALKKARWDPDLRSEEDLEQGEDSSGNERGGKGEDLAAEEGKDTCVYGDEVVEDEEKEEEDTCVYGDEVVEDEEKEEEDTCVYGDEVVEDEDDDEEEEEEDDSPCEKKEVDEELVRYFRQLRVSNGFDVYPIPERKDYYIGLIYPLDPNDPIDAPLFPRINACARRAVAHYNKFRRGKLKFLKVLKANSELVAGQMFYITFQARDLSFGEIRTYQTKVYHRFDGTMKVTFFRKKPENLEARE